MILNQELALYKANDPRYTTQNSLGYNNHVANLDKALLDDFTRRSPFFGENGIHIPSCFSDILASLISVSSNGTVNINTSVLANLSEAEIDYLNYMLRTGAGLSGSLDCGCGGTSPTNPVSLLSNISGLGIYLATGARPTNNTPVTTNVLNNLNTLNTLNTFGSNVNNGSIINQIAGELGFIF